MSARGWSRKRNAEHRFANRHGVVSSRDGALRCFCTKSFTGRCVFSTLRVVPLAPDSSLRSRVVFLEYCISLPEVISDFASRLRARFDELFPVRAVLHPRHALLESFRFFACTGQVRHSTGVVGESATPTTSCCVVLRWQHVFHCNSVVETFTVDGVRPSALAVPTATQPASCFVRCTLVYFERHFAPHAVFCGDDPRSPGALSRWWLKWYVAFLYVFGVLSAYMMSLPFFFFELFERCVVVRVFTFLLCLIYKHRNCESSTERHVGMTRDICK